MSAWTSEWTPKARAAANFLASLPSGHTTLDAKDAKSLLLQSGGQLLARGKLYNIVVSDIGAGVYRVSLTEA